MMKTAEIYDAGYAIPVLPNSDRLAFWAFRDEVLATLADSVKFCDTPPGCNFTVARIEDIRKALGDA